MINKKCTCLLPVRVVSVILKYVNHPSSCSTCIICGNNQNESMNEINRAILHLNSCHFGSLQKCYSVKIDIAQTSFMILLLSEVSKTFKAGTFGNVRWITEGKKLPFERSSFGLPSSCINDTDPAKAKEFIAGLSFDGFMVFLLYFIAGDGHVYYRYVDKTVNHAFMAYDFAQLFARSGCILSIIKERMDNNEFKNVTVKSRKDGHLFELKILNNESNNEILLEALNSMNNESHISIHSKLQLLREFLLSNNGRIPERFGPPYRLSFHQYLKQAYPKNKIACAIGQDLYTMNLFSLNSILSFAGYHLVNDTLDLNVSDFTAHLYKLAQSSSLTIEQQLAIKYYNCCKNRV